MKGQKIIGKVWNSLKIQFQVIYHNFNLILYQFSQYGFYTVKFKLFFDDFSMIMAV